MRRCLHLQLTLDEHLQNETYIVPQYLAVYGEDAAVGEQVANIYIYPSTGTWQCMVRMLLLVSRLLIYIYTPVPVLGSVW